MSETSPKEKKNPISKHSEQKPAQANMYADLKKHSVGEPRDLDQDPVASAITCT
jgi:hypothetical protein